jgi:hypothetical protein
LKVTDKLITIEQRKSKSGIFGAFRLVWGLSGFGGPQPVVLDYRCFTNSILEI